MTDAKELFLGLASAYGVEAEVAELIQDQAEPAVDRLGKLLQQTRLERGWTLLDVHSRCGLSRSQLSSYEGSHQKNPGIRTCKLVARGYDLNLAKVLLALYGGIRMPRRRTQQVKLASAPGAQLVRKRTRKR